MNLQVEPPEKKKRSLRPPSFSLLPDDITVNYLARIPRAYYPRLSTVSKSFRSILSSTEIYEERSRLGTTEQCLYVSIWEATIFPQWFRLWINPSRTLHDNSSVTEVGNLAVPIPSKDILNTSEAVVGSEIYVIGGRGPSRVVRILDCHTHTWRDAPSMKVARECPASCFYDGKIYVFGGYKDVKNGLYKGLDDDETWAEAFDLKTKTWECLPDPGTETRRRHISTIAEIHGKIKYAHDVGYDPKQGKWEHSGNASGILHSLHSPDCVIENVSYSGRYSYYPYHGPFSISWYDIKDGTWKQVKGLESFQMKHLGIPHSYEIGSSKLVSCGAKLLVLWEQRINHRTKLYCAEFKVEKRDGGEVWGQVEWDDVVLTFPSSRVLLHCLPVSV